MPFRLAFTTHRKVCFCCQTRHFLYNQCEILTSWAERKMVCFCVTFNKCHHTNTMTQEGHISRDVSGTRCVCVHTVADLWKIMQELPVYQDGQTENSDLKVYFTVLINMFWICSLCPTLKVQKRFFSLFVVHLKTAWTVLHCQWSHRQWISPCWGLFRTPGEVPPPLCQFLKWRV